MERLDKDIREKLQGYEATPSPRVWEGILAQQVKQNQTRRLLWIAGLATVAAIVIGAMLWTMRGDDVSLHDDQTASDMIATVDRSTSADRASSDTPELYDEGAFAQMSTAQDDLSSADHSAQTATSPAASGSSTASGAATKNRNTTQNTANLTDKADEASRSTSAQEVSPTRQTTYMNPTQASLTESTWSESDKVQEEITYSNISQDRNSSTIGESKFTIGGTQSTQTIIPAGISDAVQQEAIKSGAGTVQGIGTASEDIDYAVLMPRWSMPSVTALPSLMMQKQEATAESLSMASLQRRLNSYGCELNLFSDCYRHDPPSSRFYMDMYYNQVFGAFQYSTDDLELQTIADRRSEAETVSRGYGFGMRFSSFIESSVMVRAGLEYSKVTEDFLLEDVERVVIGRIITIDTTINTGTMDTMITRDTVPEYAESTTRHEYENTYEFLDIPLEIGYQWTRKRWSFSAYGGVIVNLAFDKKGTTLNDMGGIIRYDGDNIDGEEIYRTKVGLSLSTSLQAAYAVAPTADVFLEPHMRYALAPITTPNQSIRKRFYATGIRAGVRFRL